MPQVLAALVRSAPSRTIASANIRRDAALFFSRPAATRSSMAVKSLWVTAIAAIVLAPLHTKNPSIQTFSDSGIPTSRPFSPLVLHLEHRLAADQPRQLTQPAAEAVAGELAETARQPQHQPAAFDLHRRFRQHSLLAGGENVGHPDSRPCPRAR